jgi:hypothetical protein
MKDPVQNMQEQMDSSYRRAHELETKLAQLPTDAGPEIFNLYQKLLAKEKKYQAKMTLAMAPLPRKQTPKLRIGIAVLIIAWLLYLAIFG